jgi:hypothetical protein
MRSKRASPEGYWFRETLPFLYRDVSALAFGVGRVNDLQTTAQCAHGRRLLDGKTFNSDAIQCLYESADYRNATACAGIDAGIWVDVAAAVT